MARRAAVLVLAAVVIAACGSKTENGAVGDTLTDRKLRVTLTRVDRQVPRPSGRDVTGLGTPGPGMRFFGVNVKACNGPGGPAVGAFSFKLGLSGGGEARLRFPQRAYPDDFETVREGCGQGWIVFEHPDDDEAEELRFRYDDTASQRPSDRREQHSRFNWDVSAG